MFGMSKLVKEGVTDYSICLLLVERAKLKCYDNAALCGGNYTSLCCKT